MFNYYFTLGLIYLLVAFILAFLSFFIFKRNYLGKFWGASIVALVGAFVGGIVNFLFSDIIKALTQINGSINIFPPILGAVFILWLYSKLNKKQQ